MVGRDDSDERVDAPDREDDGVIDGLRCRLEANSRDVAERTNEDPPADLQLVVNQRK
jgi:hypothetical protein